eukprot:scaffold85325_cov30-Tisochrysis_lutea.AAC.1
MQNRIQKTGSSSKSGEPPDCAVERRACPSNNIPNGSQSWSSVLPLPRFHHGNAPILTSHCNSRHNSDHARAAPRTREIAAAVRSMGRKDSTKERISSGRRANGTAHSHHFTRASTRSNSATAERAASLAVCARTRNPSKEDSVGSVSTIASV